MNKQKCGAKQNQNEIKLCMKVNEIETNPHCNMLQSVRIRMQSLNKLLLLLIQYNLTRDIPFVKPTHLDEAHRANREIVGHVAS